MEKNRTMTIEEVDRHPEIHSVWIGESDKIASFHAVDSYELQTFACHDYFIQYLRSLQERGFRFQ